MDVGAQDSCEFTLQYSPLDQGDTFAAFFKAVLAGAIDAKRSGSGSRNVISWLGTNWGGPAA
jgi:hypothetical protein